MSHLKYCWTVYFIVPLLVFSQQNTTTKAIQISLIVFTCDIYERTSSQREMKKVLKGMGLRYTLKVWQ